MRAVGGLGGRGLLASALAATFALLLLVPVTVAEPIPGARGPEVGDWFSYQYDRGVQSGWGNYSGYGDAMTSHSTYRVTSVVGANVTLWGNGSYGFRNSSDFTSSGNHLAHIVFSELNRSYLSGIDVDTPTTPFEPVWFWIPSDVGVGSQLRILDENFTVESRAGTLWVGLFPLPRTGVLLESRGRGIRNDAYGYFGFTYDDRYLFDPTTGYILAEQYTETDNNGPNGFAWVEAVTVTGASYMLPTDLPLAAEYYAIGLVVAVAPFLLVLVVAPRVRQRSRNVASSAPGAAPSLQLRRVRRLADLDGLEGGGGSPFAPLLLPFARRAVWQKFPTFVGTSGNAVHALLAYDKESKTASLFAPDPAVARALYRMYPSPNYFAEVPASATGLPGVAQTRFLVLELDRPTPAPFDPNRIQPMTREHLSQVAVVAKDVYWGKTAFWVQAAFEAGDLGFVAVADQQVIGFGFAMVEGTIARLHTLTVTPAYRARGIGSQLIAARLTALSRLGVERVLVEVAEANVASLRALRAYGFRDVGVSYLYGKKRRARGVGM